MKVKTYRAPSMKEALEEVKKEVGHDAFILSGKEVKGKKMMGLFGTSYFEVTAAVDYAAPTGKTTASGGVSQPAVRVDRVEVDRFEVDRVEVDRVEVDRGEVDRDEVHRVEADRG